MKIKGSKEICLRISRDLLNYLELKVIDASEKEEKDIYLEDIIKRILKEYRKKKEK